MTASVQQQLDLWGPQAVERPIPSLAEAEAYCRHLARTHYENFPVASCFLPRPIRQHFYNVYAYCRWADDLADEIVDAERSLSLLSWWRGQLDECYAGSANHPVFVALQTTISQFEIPRAPFDDLISAFEQDQRVLEYETFEQLRDYCRRSANPVGRLVLYVCRQHCEQNVEWSDSICTGLQLANFWQDVGRDRDLGRVYLPRADRERFTYSDEALHARVTNEAFLRLMRFEVDRARGCLLAGLPLAEQLPGRLQVDVDLFARGGLKILDRIEAIGYRVWKQRPVVTKGDVLALLVGSLCRATGRRFGRGKMHAGRVKASESGQKAAHR